MQLGHFCFVFRTFSFIVIGMSTHNISLRIVAYAFLLISACFIPAGVGQITSAGPPPAKAAPKASPTPAIDPLPSNDPNELVQAAFTFLKQKKYGEAIANSAKAATLAPGDFRAPYVMALAFWSQ